MRTDELIARRASRRILAAQAGEPDWRKRSQPVFDGFLHGREQRPQDARLALVEAYAVGETALEQAWRSERVFEGMLAECFARSLGGVSVPPLVIEGVVTGIAGVARSHLLACTAPELRTMREDLLQWSLSYADEAAAELARLDRGTIWRDTTHEPLPAAPARGDRALILAAVAALAPKCGYSRLTAARVRAAGVSRRKFNASFEDLEDCYLAALEQRAADALAQAALYRATRSPSYAALPFTRQIAATLSYLALVPAIGAPAAVDAIQSEQRLTDLRPHLQPVTQ